MYAFKGNERILRRISTDVPKVIKMNDNTVAQVPEFKSGKYKYLNLMFHFICLNDPMTAAIQ